MAFNRKYLKQVGMDGSTDHARVWSYNGGSGGADDTLAEISAADYLVESPKRLTAGDMIIVHGSDGIATRRVATATTTAVTTTALSGGSLGAVWISTTLADVSAASSVFIAAPFAGTIRKMKTVLGGAITVANAAVKLQIAGVDVTGGAVTVAYTASAAGDVDEATATAANTVTAGQAVKIVSDGGSTDTATLLVMVEFVPTV